MFTKANIGSKSKKDEDKGPVTGQQYIAMEHRLGKDHLRTVSATQPAENGIDVEWVNGPVSARRHFRSRPKPSAFASGRSHACRARPALLPPAYVAGLPSRGKTAQSFAEGRTLGSLRMTSCLVGTAMSTAAASGDTAQRSLETSEQTDS